VNFQAKNPEELFGDTKTDNSDRFVAITGLVLCREDGDNMPKSSIRSIYFYFYKNGGHIGGVHRIEQTLTNIAP